MVGRDKVGSWEGLGKGRAGIGVDIGWGGVGGQEKERGRRGGIELRRESLD